MSRLLQLENRETKIDFEVHKRDCHQPLTLYPAFIRFNCPIKYIPGARGLVLTGEYSQFIVHDFYNFFLLKIPLFFPRKLNSEAFFFRKLLFTSFFFTICLIFTTIPMESKVELDLFRHRNYSLAENEQTNLNQGLQLENYFYSSRFSIFSSGGTHTCAESCFI